MSKAAQWACGFLVFIQWCPNPQALNHLSVSVRSACLLAAKLAALLLVPKAGERRIPSTVLAHESAHGERGVRASVGSLRVDVSDVDLHRAVILGLDQAVGSAALARDVEIYGGTGGVL